MKFLVNTPKKHLPSRAVQIQVMSYAPSVNNGQCHSLFALCEDGTIWQQWHSLESANVPQDGLWHPILANTANLPPGGRRPLESLIKINRNNLK